MSFRNLVKSTLHVLFLVDPCTGYNVLDESSRSTNYVDNNYFCDQDYDLTTGAINPHLDQTNWKGAGWYRFMEPAGTRMIEYPEVKGMGDCSTQDPTYIVSSDYDSIQMGEVVDREACMFNSKVFNQQGNPCFVPSHFTDSGFDKIPIKIKRCQGDYFVYELPNIAECNGRYCAISD